MTVYHVNNEMLWLQNIITKYITGLFSQLFAVEENEISKWGISISQLWDIYIKRSVRSKNKM